MQPDTNEVPLLRARIDLGAPDPKSSLPGDLTLFTSRTAAGGSINGIPEGLWENGTTLTGQCRVCSDSDGPSPTRFIAGRGLVASAYCGKQLSITLRLDPAVTTGTLVAAHAAAPAAASSPYEPQVDPDDVVPISTVRDCLWDEIFASEQQHAGLVVVTGATNSAKSMVARGLIARLLREQVAARAGRPARRPHLLTLEDPIERWFFVDSSGAALDPATIQALGWDYTPREIPKDIPTLEQGLRDALRQTPAVVYVGEVRTPQDWRNLLSFAGTGHLVVTTAHAGSLVEAMGRLFRATRVVTAARRGEVAESILAIVHLRRFLAGATPGHPPIVPALWRRSASGVAALVSDGLSSLLPYDRSDSASCVGRRWFAERLADLRKSGGKDVIGWRFQLTKQAREADLGGI
ncbi:MAG TPA: ATPase, T2SS/T4P/T4SS family [Candidatus Binatia bacterium]|nr:ATPase, T2SS/T4P/T4SS family [Candidatus Binatia bacterium]